MGAVEFGPRVRQSRRIVRARAGDRLGVGMRSACTQWSVERSGLGCLLTADVRLAVEMGVVG